MSSNSDIVKFSNFRLIKNILFFSLVLFIFICIFDPADKIFTLKVPIFIFCWVLTFVLIYFYNSKKNYKIHKGLFFYVFLIILIPLISIFYYLSTNGTYPYAGFNLFKSYILISISIILYINNFDLLPVLSRFLNILAFTIVGILLLIIVLPDLQAPITFLGETYGILLLGDRQYSLDLTLKSIYFVTSPMLCISISYYTHNSISKFGKEKYRAFFYTIINCVAMFVAGTRNNMFVAILLPAFIYLVYSKHKFLIGVCILTIFFFIITIYYSELLIMLNPEEESNSTKLELWNDYKRIFSNSKNLYFGQGLGSYYNWSVRGSYFISELTYLEIIRNFGLVLGLPLIFLLLFPFIFGLIIRNFKQIYFVWAYFFYLIMSISNPLFFSSLGMLILSILLANLFLSITKG